jgi:glycosyltransferase EpsE
MKISVILTAFNDEENIKKAIESILDQSYENFELITVDDGSSDNTFNILKSYKSFDSRIKVIKNNKNLGLTKSLNKALVYTQGEFIARHDSDDISLKQRFQHQVDVLNDTRYDFCISRAINLKTQKAIPRISYYLPSKFVMKYKNPFIHGTLMIRKNILTSNGGYDERFHYAQDFKLYYDLLKNGHSFYYIKEPLYLLNVENNISSNKKLEQKYYFDCVRNNISPEKIT